MNNTQEENVPYFEDKKDPVRPDKETIERETVCAIVVNKITNEVLCLNWPDFDWNTFVIGGVENNEDVILAGMREIEKETGYADIKFIGDVGKARSSFYAGHKDVNRVSNYTGLLFELVSAKQKEVDPEETKNHSYKWIPKDEVAEYINIDAQKYLWDRALKLLD